MEELLRLGLVVLTSPSFVLRATYLHSAGWREELRAEIL